MTRKSSNELWLATIDFDLPKKEKNCDFILKKMELRHHHKRKHLGTMTFHWIFPYPWNKVEPPTYLQVSPFITFNIHNSYFTGHHLMPSWSIFPYQGLRCEGYHGWATLWSKNKHSMESSISVSPTISCYKAGECMPYSIASTLEAWQWSSD